MARIRILSPKLRRSTDEPNLLVTLWGDPWWQNVNCKAFDLPDSRWYWIELSTRQWPDGSGVAVRVQTCGYNACVCIQHKARGRWCWLYSLAGQACRRLGVTAKPKTIYLRIWYQ